MQPTPTLYLTQGSGNSFKAALVAHQLAIQTNRKYIDVVSGEAKQPTFLAINPQGVVPYLTQADGTGLGESNAIAWYLAEGSSLIPDTSLARAQTMQWMNFEQTTLEANISPIRFFTAIAPELGAEQTDMIPLWLERGNAGLAILNNHLNDHDFIIDHGYSVADIAVYGYTHLAGEGGFDLIAYPGICQWIERVSNQNGYLSINELLDGKDLINQSIAA